MTSNPVCADLYAVCCCLFRECHIDNHVTERTDLPNHLIVGSQGTDIFTQELPRVIVSSRWEGRGGGELVPVWVENECEPHTQNETKENNTEQTEQNRTNIN